MSHDWRKLDEKLGKPVHDLLADGPGVSKINPLITSSCSVGCTPSSCDFQQKRYLKKFFKISNGFLKIAAIFDKKYTNCGHHINPYVLVKTGSILFLCRVIRQEMS
jgi:hypothetical protein